MGNVPVWNGVLARALPVNVIWVGTERTAVRLVVVVPKVGGGAAKARLPLLVDEHGFALRKIWVGAKRSAERFLRRVRDLVGRANMKAHPATRMQFRVD
jgi:hypothetical protein